MSKKWLNATFLVLRVLPLAKNMRFRPGKLAGTDPLRRTTGQQNPQSTKTFGFHLFCRTPQVAFPCPCGAIHLVSSEPN